MGSGFDLRLRRIRCDHRPQEWFAQRRTVSVGDQESPRSPTKSFDVARKLKVNRVADEIACWMMISGGKRQPLSLALGHHRWLRLKVTDGKLNGDVTMPREEGPTARLVGLRVPPLIP